MYVRWVHGGIAHILYVGKCIGVCRNIEENTFLMKNEENTFLGINVAEPPLFAKHFSPSPPYFHFKKSFYQTCEHHSSKMGKM